MTTVRDEPTIDALKHHLGEHAKRDEAHRRHVRELVDAASQQTTSGGDGAPSRPAGGETP